MVGGSGSQWPVDPLEMPWPAPIAACKFSSPVPGLNDYGPLRPILQGVQHALQGSLSADKLEIKPLGSARVTHPLNSSSTESSPPVETHLLPRRFPGTLPSSPAPVLW